MPVAPGINDAFLRGYIFSRPEYALLRRPPYVDAENEVNAWLSELCRRAGTRFGENEPRDEKVFAAEARRMIAQHPGETLRKVAVGVATFWYPMTTPLSSLATGALVLIAAAFAAAGLGRARTGAPASWILATPIVSMNLFIAALCSLGRYSVPIIPCLMLLAAFGVDTLSRGAADDGGDPVSP